MTALGWSVVLQWSRVGIGAVLFLVAARFLSLAELGLFATAFAPARLTQSLHRAGIGEAVIVYGHRSRRVAALFTLSLGSGVALCACLVGAGVAIGSPHLAVLALVPLVNGLGAVSEGLLRRALRLRALAVRTFVCQSIAAAIALWMLVAGFGPWALVAFALINVSLAAGLSIWLAAWPPRATIDRAALGLILPKVAQIAGRDLLGSGLLPVVQMLVAAVLGLAAAGAFQIAVRLLGLIDALSLAPLRFTALPSLRGSRGHGFAETLQGQLQLSATVIAWVWGGTLAAVSEIVTLAVGPEHASEATGVLIGLAGFGLVSGLTMPIAQALTARGQTALVLGRAAMLFGGGVLVSLPLLRLSTEAVAAGLGLWAFIVALGFLGRGLPRLGLTWSDLLPVAPPLVAATAMTVALWLLPPLPLWAMVLVGTAIYAGLLSLGRARSWVAA